MSFLLPLRRSPTDPSTLTIETSATAGIAKYLRTWSDLSTPEFTRKIIIFLIFFGTHTPLNVLSFLSHGPGLGMILGLVFSLLNLICVGVALWKIG
jgi:hypothetical protein